MKTFIKYIVSLSVYFLIFSVQLFFICVISVIISGNGPSAIIGIGAIITFYTSFLLTRRIHRSKLFNRVFSNKINQ